MVDAEHFGRAFSAMTGHAPFRWQRRLYDEWLVLGRVPAACDIATGLGKTSVMAVWLLALAHQASGGQVALPRRLVYVVNRRTVVDQATDTAMTLRAALRGSRDDGQPILQAIRGQLSALCARPDDDASPLAISTLRGELADNREWQDDPARPTIIIGTVDMIGSRLLLSGYGVSRRMRPFHAGLMGQDTLIVHDEAHLTPAFGALLREIARRQRERNEPCPLQVMELSATQRGGADASTFTLTESDEAEAEVRRRLCAVKTLRIHTATTRRKLESRLVELALAHERGRVRVLVYVRSPRAANAIAARLGEKVGDERVAVLTGTIRGHERDRLAESPLFRGFRAQADRKALAGTEYLVATSAGEVGADLDADHMVCDLTTLDSMIQRLGRVNRLGQGSAVIDVVPVADKEKSDDHSGAASDDRLARTQAALESLPDRDGGKDASPCALRRLAGRDEAFAAAPRPLPLTDILLDGWAMTRLDELPGRPPVERWLRGVEASPPQLHVAWRAEVSLLGEVNEEALRALYDRHPVLARERLRGNVWEVVGEIEKIAKRSEGARGVLLPATGAPRLISLRELRAEDERLHEATIVLPPELGGLDARGMLDGSRAEPVHDVADDPSERLRVLLARDPETEVWTAQRLVAPEGITGAVAEAGSLRDAIARACKLVQPRMAEKARLVLGRDEDGEPTRILLLLARPSSAEVAQDSPAAGARPQELEQHLDWTRAEAERLAARLGLARDLADALAIAARWHDRGKDRPAWQKAIGHPPPSRGQAGAADWRPWAKSGARGFDASACGRYRHELGSLREAAADPAIGAHPERDLILHLIAAHHGWARPHFLPEHGDIADGVTEEECAELAAEAMRRFARLQRRFGHWGLAWLEALLRSADYAATRRLAADGGKGSEEAP